MFSALKFLAAGIVLALSGSFLLSGVLNTQQNEELTPAAETDSASPTGTFPTGLFVANENLVSVEFREDGTCRWLDPDRVARLLECPGGH